VDSASRVGEKERLLDHLVASGGRLFFSRDPDIAMIKVTRDRQACSLIQMLIGNALAHHVLQADHHRCILTATTELMTW